MSGANNRSWKQRWWGWLWRRRGLERQGAFLLLFSFCLSFVRSAFAAPTDIVATVGDQAILMREIDEMSTVQLSKIHDALSGLLARTVERLIDEQLRSITPPEVLEELSRLPTSPAVTNGEVQSYRAAHEKEVLGTSAGEGGMSGAGEQIALLRYYLEQKAREAAEAQVRQRLRQGHVIRLSLPRPQELESPMTQERQIAQVDTFWIRAAEFEQAAAWRLYQLREEIYRERRRNLEPTIENVLFSNEARRRGITIEALYAELSTKEAVSEEEILAFTTAEQEAGRPAPTVERAQVYLEFRKAYDRRQALLKKLRKSIPIKIFLREPPVPYLPVEDTGFAVLGAKRGKRLVVYTNYRCPACRTVQQEIDTLLTQDKKVRVVFHDFIPGFDPVATEAVYLTRCAAQWGVFSRIRQELLIREPPTFGQHWYKESELPQLMRRLGVKQKKEFLDCLGTEVYKAIEHDTANARALGFEAPPMFIAEGIPVAGTPTAEDLTRALAQGLKNPAQGMQEERVGVSYKRRKGRRPRRPWRSSKKQEATMKGSSRSVTDLSMLQKPKLMAAQLPVVKKPPPKPRRDKLFDME